MAEANSINTGDVGGGSCSWCDGGLRQRQYVQAAGSALLVFCSEECLRASLRDDAATRWAARRRNLLWFAVATFSVAACITPHDELLPPRTAREVPAQATAAEETLGPEWPPTEANLIDELGHDAWLHPMAGPLRRMPTRDSRVFGAERPGDRPVECRKGHCGVDLGGEIWGEQVHAAHDGVVDRVQRGANDQHGGHYVRVAHRGGAVFTQYFHLAAVPRWVEVGAPVKAGDVIGLLGDTGIKESEAHLHFTVSVRPTDGRAEQYIDPEPLVALWPLRIPLAGSPVVLVSTAGKPGVPLGGAPAGPTRKHDPAKRGQPAKTAATDDVKSAHAQQRAARTSDEGEAERSASGPVEDAPPPETSE